MKKKINEHIIKLRRQAGLDFKVFRKYYFPHHSKTPDARFHAEICEMLHLATHQRGVKTALAAPRGSAKSTIVTLEYVVYSLCYGLEDFIVIASNTSKQAISFLTNIKQELETNVRLKCDFPEVCEIGRKPKPPRWSKDNIITKNGIEVLAVGAGQNIRGRRNKDARPTLFIMDDLETDDEIRNPDAYDRLYDWVTKSVLKIGSADTNIFILGTVHHYNSLLAQFTSPNQHPRWGKRVYRSVISWPDHMEFWEQWRKIFNNHEDFDGECGPEAARRFYEINKEEMDKGVGVLWPQSKSFYDLMIIREEDGEASFDSEMQNEPVDPSRCLFRAEENHYWFNRFGSLDGLLKYLGHHAEFFGSCDPSLGRQNRHSDNSAIVIAVKDTRDGTIYIIIADIAKRTPDKTVEDILAYIKKWNIKRFAIETNNFQQLMADELEKRARQRGLDVTFVEIEHMSDKKGRIEALHPLLKTGTVQLCEKHYSLLEEMRYFPRGRHDDGLDALEMTVRLCQKHSGGFAFFSATEDYDVFPIDSYQGLPISMIVLPEPTKHRHITDFRV